MLHKNMNYNELKTNISNRQYAIDALAKIGQEKYDRAYNLAYEYGHSSGESEVNSYFRDLLELLTN